MVKAWLALALSAASFGNTITYNYTGNPFTLCNGTTSVTGGPSYDANCPVNSFIDHVVASLTFDAPIGANLASVNLASSPSLAAWMIGDSLGNIPAFSSSDPNAASELSGTGVGNTNNGLSLSTNSSGAITGWAMAASNSQTSVGINNPTFIGGSGFPFADGLIGEAGGMFWHVGNGLTGTWTQTLNGYQGGTTAAPMFLLGGSPVAGVNGTIGGQGSQEYYGFFWAGGVFSTTAAITSPPSAAASYLFTEGPASSFCSGGASQTLDSTDSFTSTISISNLAPGQYCIGIDANNPNDPNFSLTFNTPVSGTPEPSSFALLFVALGMIGGLYRFKRSRNIPDLTIDTLRS